MTEEQALKKFVRCTQFNDLDGAREALQFISPETVNRQDADGRDMLIRAVAARNTCAVEALLDGRCDLTHKEKHSGKTAVDLAMECPEKSRIRQLFLLRKYHPDAPFNLGIACERNDVEVVVAHLSTGCHPALNENFVYHMPPGFLQELPLARAVRANAAAVVKLLLERGADPDAFCRKNEKTPRELAADKPEIRKLFGGQ